MGLGDIFKNALANDPNLPPPKDPGLSKKPDLVLVEFLPSKKTVEAYPGQSFSLIAKSAGVDIRYKCKKGDCNTCAVQFNGRSVKACQSTLPAGQKKVQITIPGK